MIKAAPVILFKAVISDRLKTFGPLDTKEAEALPRSTLGVYFAD